MAVVPAGFRFVPTDEEVIAYLRDEWMTTDSMRLGFIHDIDLYGVEPWKLWEWFSSSSNDIVGGQDCLYFFSPMKKKSQNGTNVDRTVVVKGEGSSSAFVGTWKFQTAGVNIIDSTTGMPIGLQKKATFMPQMETAMEDNEHDDTGCSSSSKKRKKLQKAAPEEMQGISYIMHEYTLCPYENQIYSLCRIRRKIDKKMMNTNKKMRISNTTSSTSTSSCCREVVQPTDQEENNIHGLQQQAQQQQEEVVSAQGEVLQQSSEDNEAGSDIKAIEEFLLAGLDEEFMPGSLGSIDEFLSSLQHEIEPVGGGLA